MKLKRKGAIELSASFIIVIIISLVIVVGGLSLFFKIKGNAQDYVDKLDRQTQDNIKSIMLSNNYKVAVYPNDLTLKNGGSELVGIGITNIHDTQNTFTVELTSVKYYVDPQASATVYDDPAILDTYNAITNPQITIKPKDQDVKGMLLKMASTQKGQYVYTINVTSSSGDTYGVVQVYVTN